MAQKKKKVAKKKAGVSSNQKVGIAVGLTAAAVAAAGTYFLYGSENAEQNRKKVKSWGLKAKAEVLEALEGAEDITREEYMELVATVAASYDSAQGVTKGEIRDFKKEMQDNWKNIEQTGAVKKVKSASVTAAQSVAAKAMNAAKKKTTKKKPAKKKAAKKTTKKKAAPKKVKKTTTKKKPAKKTAKKTTKKI